MTATSALLVGTEGLARVLQSLAVRARELTAAEFAAISTFNEAGTLERFVYAGIDDLTARRIGPPPRGVGLLGALVQRETPLRCDEVADSPEFTGFPAYHPPMGPFLGVPIRSAGRTIGSFYVTRSPGSPPFGIEEETSLVILALQAATAVSAALARERGSRLALLEERASIAHDLHDGTIQALYALGLELDTHLRRPQVDPDTRELLSHGVARINQLIADIRQYITMLEADAVDAAPDLSRDLAVALQQLVPPGIDTVLNVSASALLHLEGRTSEDLLYIAREAISNAVRHAQPSRIAVDLRQVGDEVALTVQDNGTGFEPATARTGLGTVSMRTRAQRLGGTLTLVSIPGMGTMVRVALPRYSDDEPD